MSTNKTESNQTGGLQLAVQCALLLAFALTLAGNAAQGAATNPAPLRISLTPTPEGLVPELSWDSLPGAIYRVQATGRFGDTAGLSGADMVTVDVLVAVSNRTHWLDSPVLTASRFYRLLLPQPEIFRIEPAVVSNEGGEVYVIGQGLGTNGTLSIGGVAASVIPGGNVLSSGLAYRCVVPPMPEGIYDVEWIEGGQAVARREKILTVTVTSGLAQRLLEPPDEPPGSPERTTEVTGEIELDSGRVMKVKEKGGRTKCGSMMRTTPSGEFQLQETDLVIPGVGLDFAWVRTYRSRTGTTTPMGVNWDHSYNIQITGWNDASGHLDLWDGTGRSDRFFQGTNGVYTRDEFFCEATVTDGVCLVTFPDTGRWEFNRFDGSPAAGKISRIVDRNGNSTAMAYDDVGRLVTIVDTLGRSNTLAYIGGFISSLTDFTGRIVRFAHSRGIQGTVGGDLITVTSPVVTNTPNGNDFPAGKTTRYGYSTGFADERLNHNLASITDPKNQTWLQVVYRPSLDPASPAFDTVDYLQRGPYREKLRRFPQVPAPSNHFAVVKCIVNDAVGNVCESFYDSMNRCVRQLDYTGRANPDLPTNETQNRPAGKLRAGDPDFFESRLEWNPDSLCTRIVYPRGNMTEMVYQRAYNQNAARSNRSPRHDGDLRIVRDIACCDSDSDGDGAPDDVTALTTYLEYDARFGSPGAARAYNQNAARSNRAFNQNDSRGNRRAYNQNAARSNRRAYNQNAARSNRSSLTETLFNGEGGDPGPDFVTRQTDPRGTVSSASYDERGNLLHTETTERKSGSVKVRDYNYRASGQLTSITHPADGEGRRRRDEFAYHDIGPQRGYLRQWTVDAQGPSIRYAYEYDPVGNTTRIVDPRDFDTLYTYNALDQVTSRQTPKTDFGSVVRYATLYSYDANDNVTQTDLENRDHTGALNPTNSHWTTSCEYDLLNRVALVAHEAAHVVQQRTRYSYDGNDNLVLEESPEAVNGNDPNNVIRYQYDERDLLFRVTRAPASPEPAEDEFSYDPNGNTKLRTRVNKVEALAVKFKVASYSYDGFDRCVRVTDGMGNDTLHTYDRNGNLIRQRVFGETSDLSPENEDNRLLAETRCEYDSLDRCVATRESFFDVFTGLPIGDGECARRFSFAPNGQLTSETDDNGNTTRYAYDTTGRLLSVSDPKTNTVTYAYDNSGNVIGATQLDRSELTPDAQRFTQSYEYDGLNRLVHSSDNLENTVRCFYDSQDNLTRQIDERGTLHGWEYDGLGRALLIAADLDDDGGFEPVTEILKSQSWDDNSRLVSSTDANGNVTRYAYDSLDRLVTTAHADQTMESLVWSPRSNVSQRTDPNGSRIDFTYDLLDRCVRKAITPGPGVADTTTEERFEYDGLGRLTRAQSLGSAPGIDHTFVWNSLSDLVSESSGGLTVRSSYDGLGNRLQLDYPEGRQVQYGYDSLNRVARVDSSPTPGGPPLNLATYNYDGPDRLARIGRRNGANTRINWNGFPGSGQLPGDFGWQQVVRVNHARAGAAGQQVIDQRVFAYDRAQNKTLRAQTAPFSAGGPTQTNTFALNKLHRLTRATKSLGAVVEQDTTYALDNNGNRQQVISNGVVEPYQMDATLPDPGDFQMNQYTITPFGPQQHDRNGNLISVDGPAGATMYFYDYADRLVLVQRTQGPAIIPVAGYAYDALGRRIAKTIFPPGASPVTSEFVYDGEQIIEERENGTLRKVFVLPHVLEVSGRLMMSIDGQDFFVHEDDLGNALALTDAAGEVVERYDYDDYGLPQFLDSKGAPLLDNGLPVSASPSGNSFLFHGMFWDDESELYFGHSQGANTGPPGWMAPESFRDRVYNPQTGRYHSRIKRELAIEMERRGGFGFRGDEPWPLGSPSEEKKRKKGTVKFFNETKGFGRMAGGYEVMFNPKEYTISKKVIVRGWDPKEKKAFTGPATMEEGGSGGGEGGGRTLHAKQDVYVWRGHSCNNPRCNKCTKSDVYVWKLRSHSNTGGGGGGEGGGGTLRAKQDVYVWKLCTCNKPTCKRCKHSSKSASVIGGDEIPMFGNNIRKL